MVSGCVGFLRDFASIDGASPSATARFVRRSFKILFKCSTAGPASESLLCLSPFLQWSRPAAGGTVCARRRSCARLGLQGGRKIRRTISRLAAACPDHLSTGRSPRERRQRDFRLVFVLISSAEHPLSRLVSQLLGVHATSPRTKLDVIGFGPWDILRRRRRRLTQQSR